MYCSICGTRVDFVAIIEGIEVQNRVHNENSYHSIRFSLAHFNAVVKYFIFTIGIDTISVHNTVHQG